MSEKDIIKAPFTELLISTETKTKRPPIYEVVVLNDDFTPMDFVVMILQKFFNKPYQEAVDIMLKVHHHGQGICGIYTREVAETKVMSVIDCARNNNYPLKCVMHKREE